MDSNGEHWRTDLQEQQSNMEDQQRNREPHSRPDDTNLQIYPTATNSRIEHLYIEIYDPEPTTRAGAKTRRTIHRILLTP